MHISARTKLSAYSFVLLGFKNCESVEKVEKLFDSPAETFLATDYNGERHVFFIDAIERTFEYYRPYIPLLDGPLTRETN